VTDNWDDEFDWPIRLPGGGELVTVPRRRRLHRQASEARAHDPKPEWQTAIRDLMRAAAGHGPWRFFARLAIMHALYRKTPPPIGNPQDAPPAPKWRNQKRDPWR
jgi:hypothetical protein